MMHLMLQLLVLLVMATTMCNANLASEEDKRWYEQKLANHETLPNLVPQAHILRLGPGEDLLESIWRYARVTNLTAASLVTAVGSLTTTNIRYANQEDGTVLNGHFEIVSLVGQVDFQNPENLAAFNITGSGHVHISCSDEKGRTIGGHLLSGNIVYTTAEISILSYEKALFTRELDNGPKGSGYYELKVYPQHP